MLPYACASLSSCAYAAISSAFGLSSSIDENFVSFRKTLKRRVYKVSYSKFFMNLHLNELTYHSTQHPFSYGILVARSLTDPEQPYQLLAFIDGGIMTNVPEDFATELLAMLERNTHQGRTPRRIVEDECIYHIRVIDQVRARSATFPDLLSTTQRNLLRYSDTAHPPQQDFRDAALPTLTFVSQGSRSMSRPPYL